MFGAFESVAGRHVHHHVDEFDVDVRNRTHREQLPHHHTERPAGNVGLIVWWVVPQVGGKFEGTVS